LPRPNWSRTLPRPIVIPKVMTLKTLADVRTLLRHLPAEHRERPTWRHVAAELERAAPAPRRRGTRARRLPANVQMTRAKYARRREKVERSQCPHAPGGWGER
jgi:hypothetical protein